MRSTIRNMEVPWYPPLERGFIRMDANTNLVGVNPAIYLAAKQLSRLEINHYPHPYSDALRKEIARFYGIDRDGILVGNGSDEIIDMLTKAFSNPGDRICFPGPSFVMYDFYARVNMGNATAVELSDDFSLSAKKMLALKPAVVFIASPNNPTGNAFARDDIMEVVLNSRSLVVIDEAYADYCRQNLLELPKRHRNVVVTRTFSKAFGLAGLRVGFAYGHPATIRTLYKVRPPFSVGAFSECAALIALRHPEFLKKSVRIISAERRRMAQSIRRFEPYPSDSNFMLIRIGRKCGAVVRKMRQNGILVRRLPFRRIADCIRVTIGLPQHNKKFMRVLDSV